MTGNAAAIGFVLAAKAFARFKQLDDRDFAEYVLGQVDGFDHFDFSEFGKIFDVISIIVAVR